MIKAKAITVICFICGLVQAQPVFQSSSTNVGNAANATVNKPAGTVANDLLVIGLMYEKGSDEDITPPAGWTLRIRNDNSTDAGQSIYYRIADGTEPATFSFGLANGSKWAIGCSRIDNVDQVTPIDVSNGTTGNSSFVRAPSVTTTVDNTLVLCFYTNKKDATYTPHGSTTERYDNPNNAEGNPSNMMATFTQATAGGTFSKDATASEDEAWSGSQVAITPQSTLPIELLFFQAQTINNKVQIDWATASETNNDFFQVERSEDGFQFNQIATVDGAGNSSTTINYSIVDKSATPGIAYYRLKQTDFNGDFKYSNIESVEYNLEPEVAIFPNPTDGKVLYLTLNGLKETWLSIRLFSPNGRLVCSERIKPNEGLNQIEFSCQIPAGAYLLHLEGHDFKQLTQKVIVK